MNQAFHLYRLQQIDSQIDKTEAGIAELDRLLSGDAVVNQATAAAEETDKQLISARKILKQLEFAVKEQQIKIEQSEASLYGGRIRSPKELQDIQKEVASFKKQLTALEDQQLDAMLALEDAEKLVQAAQADLSQANAGFAERSAGWRGQKEQLLRSRERLSAERNAALSLVLPKDLQIYEQMRKRKNGVAVTTIQDGSCAVCGTTIRPSELQAARAAQDFVYCSSCGRIIYAG